MKDEYDFSNAERGRFYKPTLRLIAPVRIEPGLLGFLADYAETNGTTVNEFVNRLLKKHVESLKKSG